ncbi:MAG TPA: winged helix-turn-helix domain-containing protein [Solirubrobacteraceae bacterium]|nr:winged helix-turn-helix domain-containing protein [Solirubrobacteraceae bacterium]
MGDADIAAVAALIGDRTRARFLHELLGGEGRRASELASTAGVSRSTASFHLGRLLAANLVEVRVHGGRRSYRLAGPEVARAIESLQRIAPRQTVRSLRAASTAHALDCARFCYDHLAGRLAIELVDAMTTTGLLTFTNDHFELTEQGISWFRDLGIDIDALRAARRSFARACLDWSERRPHLAGATGAALAGRFIELGWIERAAHSRAVTLTPTGRIQLHRTLGIKI